MRETRTAQNTHNQQRIFFMPNDSQLNVSKTHRRTALQAAASPSIPALLPFDGHVLVNLHRNFNCKTQ